MALEMAAIYNTENGFTFWHDTDVKAVRAEFKAYQKETDGKYALIRIRADVLTVLCAAYPSRMIISDKYTSEYAVIRLATRDIAYLESFGLIALDEYKHPDNGKVLASTIGARDSKGKRVEVVGYRLTDKGKVFIDKLK